MVKGQAVILLLIIVVLVGGFLFLSPQIFRPTGGPQIVYKNDIITMENFEISNLRPIEGSSITVSFDVTNNGDKKVDKVDLDFGESTNVRSGSFNFVECGLQSDSTKAKKCEIKSLESLESRKVTVRYQVGNDFSQTIIVKVSYSYSGTREALIPIVDDKTVKRPLSQFRQSEPSPGPFVVDVIPPTKGWAIADQPFEIKFKLRYVGSTVAGKPTEPLDKLNIDDDNFIVKLKQLEVATPPKAPEIINYLWKLSKRSNQQTCQLFGEQLLHKGNILPTGIGEYEYCSNLEEIRAVKNPISCSAFVPAIIKGENYLINEAEEQKVYVNKEYSCALQAANAVGNFGLRSGVIDINYFYDFEFEKSQTINVIKSV